ncbi:MAG: radical SAM family heme chaperone HemW [Alphaproteobacteria bacterium]
MNTAGVPSLYIHWPFCAAKCPYCDFNVHISKAEVEEEVWVRSLLSDLKWQMAGQNISSLKTIYFGGGTPSLLSPKSVGLIIEGATNLWNSEEVQITLEVHPTNADQAKFKDFRAAGINRVSIGVQSFDDQALTFLGRDHKADEARDAVIAARDIFEDVSVDLMTALPGMSLSDQQNQLDTAIAFGVEHLSVYQLNVEPATAFGAAVKRGDWKPMDNDKAADFYEATVSQLSKAGLNAYEVSNYSRPGRESRHSLLGWLGQGYLGIGPGAEGRSINKKNDWERRITRRSPSGYLKQVKQKNHGLEVQETLPHKDRVEEQLIFGLRLTSGLPLNHEAWEIADPDRIGTLVEYGDLEETSSHRRATMKGRLRLDALNDYLVNYEG